MKRDELEALITQQFDEGRGRDIFTFLLENASTDTLIHLNEKIS